MNTRKRYRYRGSVWI